MRRKHKAQPAMAGVNLSLIVTPMLDMAFQLLAFFIMTYHPSSLEGFINGKLLPPEKRAEKSKGSPAVASLPSVDTPPELTDALRVLVKAVPKGQPEGGLVDGEPRWVEIYRKESTTPITLNGDKSGDKEHFIKSLEIELKEKLKSILSEPSAPDKSALKLEGDSNLKHQYMMDMYDVCRRAGFDSVNFVSPPVEKTAP